jgi:radical SAM protein with 4Fe4S-binding SPASM domain
MCGIWEEKDIGQFDNALLNKLPDSLRTISLTGGEPFLRNDLPEIIERAKSVCSKSRIVIPTNGILTDVITEQMKKIVKIDPKIAVRVSIDGIGELHDNIRGVKNAYASVINTLKSLKELRIRDLGIIITISDINLREMGKVYEIAKEKKVKFNCQVAHSSDFYYEKDNRDIGQKDLFKKELNLIISSELKSFNLQGLFKTYYYRGLWNYVNCMPRIYPCNAGSLFFYLSPEGNVYPCIFLDKKMGNLHDDSFDTIWYSKLAQQVREYVKRCNSNCWMICTVAPAIKNNPFRAARWVFINKLKAHLGMSNLL